MRIVGMDVHRVAAEAVALLGGKFVTQLVVNPVGSLHVDLPTFAAKENVDTMIAIADARLRGYRAMQFNFVVSTNVRAVRLWQSCGFEIVGRIPAGFNHPAEGYVDALVMYQQL